jgi:hypothetical protein
VCVWGRMASVAHVPRDSGQQFPWVCNSPPHPTPAVVSRQLGRTCRHGLIPPPPTVCSPTSHETHRLVASHSQATKLPEATEIPAVKGCSLPHTGWPENLTKFLISLCCWDCVAKDRVPLPGSGVVLSRWVLSTRLGEPLLI